MTLNKSARFWLNNNFALNLSSVPRRKKMCTTLTNFHMKILFHCVIV